MKAVVFEAPREGYAIDQIAEPMTVGQLISLLSDLDPETLFVLSHDRGYTYGSISEYDMTMMAPVETEYGTEWEEQDW